MTKASRISSLVKRDSNAVAPSRYMSGGVFSSPPFCREPLPSACEGSDVTLVAVGGTPAWGSEGQNLRVSCLGKPRSSSYGSSTEGYHVTARRSILCESRACLTRLGF